MSTTAAMPGTGGPCAGPLKPHPPRSIAIVMIPSIRATARSELAAQHDDGGCRDDRRCDDARLRDDHRRRHEEPRGREKERALDEQGAAREEWPGWEERPRRREDGCALEREAAPHRDVMPSSCERKRYAHQEHSRQARDEGSHALHQAASSLDWSGLENTATTAWPRIITMR